MKLVLRKDSCIFATPKFRTMKNYVALAISTLISLTFLGCNNSDMTQTDSGLSYKYNKRGEGRQVERGSFVKAKLSLMVEDSVIWTTYEFPDSVYGFVVGYSSVIKGFEEMALLMNEGDDMYVSIPDSLAYGDEGSGIVPPNATLIYDKYEMVSVSAPKQMVADTIAQMLQSGRAEEITNFFQSMSKEDFTNQYHTQLDLVLPFINQLMQYGQMEALEACTAGMKEQEWEGDMNLLDLYYISAIAGQGRTDEALTIAEEFKAGQPNDPRADMLIQQIESQKAQGEN